MNRAVKQAKDYVTQGIKIAAIPMNKMNLVVYHDAAWGNAELEEEDGERYDRFPSWV